MSNILLYSIYLSLLMLVNKQRITDYLFMSQCIKGIFHQKYLLTLRPFKMEFVSSSEPIWRNLALYHYHLLTNGSSAVNGCRQNESKQLIKTLQSTSNPHHSSPSVNIFVKWKAVYFFLKTNLSLRHFNFKHNIWSIITLPSVKKSYTFV